MVALPLAERRRIGDLLLDAGLITRPQLDAALDSQRTRRKRLGEILTEDGLLDDVALSAVLSVQLDAPLVDLRSRPSDDEALVLVAEADARRLKVLPLQVQDGRLVVAIADPEDAATIGELEALAGCRVEVLLASSSEIERTIEQRYRIIGGIAAHLSAYAQAQPSAPRVAVRLRATEVDALRDAPVVQIVNLLVEQALRDRASDLHIEPQADGVRIRVRIDGILHDVAQLPSDIGPGLASRIKIMSELNIVEKQRAQDGQISMDIDGRAVDIRVATMRTIWGEKVVLRLLDKERNVLDLDELGFPTEVAPAYRTLLHAPFGMVIVAGPTGSGKTTTLYASMNELDRSALNVTTIEDPVEYTLGDVNQTQVNLAAGITFASGLRAILRQDPDIILVGEMRDHETAEIAVQAALTGHLVLTSMHATDATGALFRLLEMGVEPFLVSASVTGVAAQRLMRRICPHCRIEIEPTLDERELFVAEGVEAPSHVYIGRGCTYCSGTGYLDRVAAFELVRLTPTLRRLVTQGADYDRMREQVLADGMIPMRGDALRKASIGVTTVAEAIRSVMS